MSAGAEYGRGAAAQAAYEAALGATRREWRSVEDAIRARALGWARARGADGRWAAERVEGAVSRLLQPNPWPYDVPAGVEHWLLWWDEAAAPDEAEAEAFVARHAPRWAARWRVSRNPPAARSVPGLWHAHVFFERAPEAPAR